MAKRLSATFTREDLAEMFELPEFDVLEEANRDYISDRAGSMGDTPEEEDAYYEREGKVIDELFEEWKSAVEHVADHEFDEAGLELKQTAKAWIVRITPKKDWRDAARKIMEVINGVGWFDFLSLAEFLDSGPYTPRQAVLSHLHVLADRAEVYGDTRPRYRFDRYFG